MIDNNEKQFGIFKIPCGSFCGKNCADGCIYWQPYDRRDDGRQWCNYYNTYYYPTERNGCFNFKG